MVSCETEIDDEMVDCETDKINQSSFISLLTLI